MQKNYYAIIPANVRYDEELKPNAKLLYGEITALANEKGYCWASNSYFSKLYGVSKETVSRWINNLENKGYIYTQLIYKEGSKEIKERRIYITPIDKKVNTYCQNNQYPIDKKVNTPIDKKVKENNTVSNNTVNNTVYILSNDEKKFLEVLEQVENYPIDREKDLEMYKTLKERYPELDLLEAIETWRLYKLDKPLKANSNPRSQINNSFKKYVEWGRCLKKGDSNGTHKERDGENETEAERLWKLAVEEGLITGEETDIEVDF